MPKPDPQRDRRRQTFLRLLAAGEPAISAAGAAGIPRSTLYIWRRDAPKFRAAWDRAAALARDALADRFQAALIERAIEGVDEPVFHAGKLIGTRKRYSDALLLAGLRELQDGLPPATEAASTPKRAIVVIEPFEKPRDPKSAATTRPIATAESKPVAIAEPAAAPAPPRPLSRWGDDVDPATDERW